MKRSSFLLALMLAAVVVSSSSLAAADIKTVLQFDVNPADRPDILCVVSPLSSSSVVMKEIGNAVAGDIWEFHARSDRRAVDGGGAIDRAVGALLVGPGEPCSFSELCAPRVVLAESKANNKVMCRENNQGTKGDRVVFVRVDGLVGINDKPMLTSLELNNTGALLQWSPFRPAPSVTKPEIAAEVIGGSYARTLTKSDHDKIVLPLVPRCKEHDVQLPPIAFPPPRSAPSPKPSDERRTTITVTNGAKVPAGPRCEVDLWPEQRQPTDGAAAEPKGVAVESAGARHRLRMMLPYEQDTTKRVTLKIGSPLPEPTVLVSEWTTLEPPSVLTPKMQEVSFAWARDCMYPKDLHGSPECPRARLPEPGVECGAGALDGDTCYYHCPAAPVPFALPTPVRFERELTFYDAEKHKERPDLRDVWEVPLNYGNQVLTGYVAPERRYVEVDFSKWVVGAQNPGEELRGRKFRPGDSIYYVDVAAPSGQRNSVVPEFGQRIPMPGAGCQETVKYSIDAQRAHRPYDQTIHDGVLVIEPPETTAVVFNPGIRISAGLNIHKTADRSNLDTQFKPFGAVEAIFGWRPKTHRETFELRVGYIFGQEMYFSAPGGSALSASFVWYHRVPISFVVIEHVYNEIYVGGGPQLVVTRVVSPGDEARVPETWAYPAVPFVFGYVLPGRNMAVEADVTPFFFEKVFAFPFVQGVPVLEQLSSFGVRVGVGMRFGRR